MKISIITPTYNSEQFLYDNLKSINSQNYKNLEHIFIDNLSNDKTLDILKDYKKKVDYNVTIYSSKDNGIYYAFNKGLKYVKGDLVTIVNSDDYLSNKFVLRKVLKIFKNKKKNFLYSNVKIVSRFNKNKLLRLWKSEKVTKNEFYKVPHPSFFIKKSFIKKNKLNFNTSYKIASDLDFIIRCLKKSSNYDYVNNCFVTQRSGGTSQKFLNIIRANNEVYKICKDNRINFSLLFLFKKLLFKICQIK